MAKKLTVFLSSTGADLADFRKAVMDRLRVSDHIHCDGMEAFGARDSSPEDFCRKRAQECDVFVGLIGHYRGNDVPGDNEQRSFTEMEYASATDAKKPRLMYIVPDDFHPTAPSQSKKAERQQAAFRKRVLANRVISKEFQSPDRLAGAIAVDLMNLLAEKIAAQIAAERVGAALPGQQQAVVEAVSAVVAGADEGDDRMVRALKLLEENKLSDAEPLLREVAEEKAANIEIDRKKIVADSEEAAAAYRHLGAIAGLHDPKQAVEAYSKASELDPDDIHSHLWVGYLQMDRGNLDEAAQRFRRVEILAKKGNQKYYLYWSALGNGDIEIARGHLDAAFATYKVAKESIERLTKNDPGNAERQRDLTVSYDKIGDVLVAQGALPDALNSFRKSLAIMDRLTKASPSNTGWQRDLAVSYNKVGDVLVAQGALPVALKSFRDGLAIIDRLAKADAGNTVWQRDLSVSYNKIGDVLVAQDMLPEALKSFRDSLAIRDGLAKADPDNAGWQRDLSVSYNKVGDMLAGQRALPEALKSFRDSLAIVDRLAKADPSNAGWQRDLSVSYDRIGEVLLAQGELSEALKSFRDSLAIAERLAKADPSNALWQTDIVASNAKLALAGDDSESRWKFVVKVLRRLKAEGKITFQQEKDWLPRAEMELAKSKQTD
jgi:tetratricopeptide (TPR) repeat protein